MAVVLHGLGQLLGVEVNDFSHVVVRAGLARPTSSPTSVKLSAVGPFRCMAVVLLFDVRVKRGVREVALATAALVGSSFVVVL